MDITTLASEVVHSTPSSLASDREYCIKLLNELKTKSSVIRYLTAENWKRGRIAKGMDIIYQHVRNEQLRHAKKSEAK